MKPVALIGVIVIFACFTAWASEPGQPLDCSDWVFLEPGLSCVVEIPPGQCPDGSCSLDSRFVDIDNSGARYSLRTTNLGPCPCGGAYLWRISLMRLDAGNATLVGYIESRCFESAGYPGADLIYSDRTVIFDRTNGKMLIPLESRCSDCQSGNCPYTIDYQGWLAGIVGFSTTFEILQSYTPQPAQVSFRVPYMPEGMPAADHFDTYWGDLSTVGNWSQAHGLQCHYPTTAPSRGDYLAVSDTLPTPQPGHGYYYVTAATYQGQTRYGRKTSGGRLSGRDPTLLPECASR